MFFFLPTWQSNGETGDKPLDFEAPYFSDIDFVFNTQGRCRLASLIRVVSGCLGRVFDADMVADRLVRLTLFLQAW